MEKIELKDGKVYLSGKAISGIEKLKIKSTAESGYADVYIKLLAKLN